MDNPVLDYFASLAPLPPEVRGAVAAAFTRHTYRRGEHLVRAGEVANYAYFIETGVLRVYITVDDTDSTLYLGIDGDFVVALPSFLQRTPSLDTVHCLDETTLYAIHYDRLQALYDQFPIIDRVGRLLIQQYALQLREHGFSLRFQSTEKRYETLLKQRPKLFQRVPLTYIASFLGMTAQAMSMVRAKFKGR